MRAVNLLPKEVQRQSAQKPVGPFVVGAVLALGGAWLLYSSRADADAQITQRKADIAQIVKIHVTVPPNVTAAQRQAFAQEGPRITALDSALKTRVPWDNVLRQISFAVPDDVTLQSLTLTAPVAADASASTVATTTVGATGVTIVGSSYSQDGVARFLARLGTVSALTNVQLTSSAAGTSDSSSSSSDSGSDTSTTSASSVFSFTMTAGIAPPEATS